MTDRIKVVCNGCSKTLAVPATAGGKAIACPSCQSIVRVPLPESAPPANPVRTRSVNPPAGKPAAKAVAPPAGDRQPRKARIVSSAGAEQVQPRATPVRPAVPSSRAEPVRREEPGRRAAARKAATPSKATPSKAVPSKATAPKRKKPPADEFYDDPFDGDALYSDGDTYDDNPYEAPALPPKKRSASSQKAGGRKASELQPVSSSGSAINQILGGLALMAGATVWFVVGFFWMDIIFLYPPILFLVGLVTSVKGLIGRGN